MDTKQKYRVTDTSAPLFETPLVVEAQSPKDAAEKLYGNVKSSPLGYIVVSRMQSPFRSYVYQRVN